MERNSIFRDSNRDAGDKISSKRTLYYNSPADCIDFDDQVKKIEFEIALFQLAEMAN